MWIVWPAFLAAAVAELVFFSLFDPFDLHFFGAPLEMSRESIYAMASSASGARHRVVRAHAVPRDPPYGDTVGNATAGRDDAAL